MFGLISPFARKHLLNDLAIFTNANALPICDYNYGLSFALISPT